MPQQHDEGVPVGPGPTPPARLEWRADTLLVRGRVPDSARWPPRPRVQTSRRTIEVNVLWATYRPAFRDDHSDPTPPPYLEVRLAPVPRGQWRVRVTYHDSTGTRLARWAVDTTAN
jgi:hypothetical protein